MYPSLRDQSLGSVPTILFGAYDRHNFGDLLFPHVVTMLLGLDAPIHAGLVARDLRDQGGHRVMALAQLSPQPDGVPVRIIHVGGELLTCDAWQAAVMTCAPERAEEIIRQYDTRPEDRAAWARQALGVASLAPYTVPGRLFPGATGVIYNAVGGVDLDVLAVPMRAEVLANLRAADAVGVRDERTLAHLHGAGIAARLMPDPAVTVAELFGARIAERARSGAVRDVLARHPRGYLAVQFSADFGDDATLGEIARQLDRSAASTGLGVVLFRAGAAPWHDDLAVYRRAAARMRTPADLFQSLNAWDICALVAHGRAYCGSSLHGRIVAQAYALPRVGLSHPAQLGRVTKQAAYAATWEPPGLPGTVAVPDLAAGVARALDAPSGTLRRLAGALAQRYRGDLAALVGRAV